MKQREISGEKMPIAFLLGTRVGDPNCKSLQIFDPSRCMLRVILFFKLYYNEHESELN